MIIYLGLSVIFTVSIRTTPILSLQSMHLDSDSLFHEVGLHQELTFEKPRKLLTTLEIQVSETQICPLDVHQHDDPYLLALNFCAKYQLNEIAVDVIEQRVREIVKKKGGKDSEDDSADFPLNKEVQKRRKVNKHALEIGNKLYEKGMKSIQKAEEARKVQQVKKEAEEKTQLTFKPKINEVSEKIVEIRKMIGSNPQRAKYKGVKKLNDELQECTFKPTINKVSQKIVESRNGHNEEQIVEKLYYDSVRIAARKEKAAKFQEYSYKPEINEKSRLQVRDTFMERLEKDLRHKKEKILRSGGEDEHCSFTPEIGRPPKVARNKENLPIGEYLAARGHQSRSKSEISHQTTSISSSAITNKNSESIYQNLVKKRIQLVFELLDGDRDGFISPDHIDIQELSTNTLLLLQPFFKEMDDMNAVLDERMFGKAVFRLLEGAPQNLKGEFISERWRKPQTSKPSFKPKMNNKSVQLVQEREPYDLYQQGVKSKKKKEIRTAILQAKKEEDELRQCTFKPMLNSNSQVYIRRALGRVERDDSLERFMSSSGEAPDS